MVSENDWLPQHAGILKVTGEICAVYRYLHFLSYHKFKKTNMRFTIPIIIISTVTGTANFAQGTFPEDTRTTVPLVIGGLNLIAAIATTISQFLRVSELMEAHKVAAGIYGKMSRHLRMELSLPPTERSSTGHEAVNLQKLEMDRMLEQSPTIPKDILNMFERKFPKSTHHFARPEILDIREITPFSEEPEEKLNSSSAERIKKAAMSFFSTKPRSQRDAEDIPEGDSSPFDTPPTYEEMQVSRALNTLRSSVALETPPPSPLGRSVPLEETPPPSPRTDSDEENANQV